MKSFKLMGWIQHARTTCSSSNSSLCFHLPRSPQIRGGEAESWMKQSHKLITTVWSQRSYNSPAPAHHTRVHSSESFSAGNWFNPKLKTMWDSSFLNISFDSSGDNSNYPTIISVNTVSYYPFCTRHQACWQLTAALSSAKMLPITSPPWYIWDDTTLLN